MMMKEKGFEKRDLEYRRHMSHGDREKGRHKRRRRSTAIE